MSAPEEWDVDEPKKSSKRPAPRGKSGSMWAQVMEMLSSKVAPEQIIVSSPESATSSDQGNEATGEAESAPVHDKKQVRKTALEELRSELVRTEVTYVHQLKVLVEVRRGKGGDDYNIMLSPRLVCCLC